MIRFSRKYSKGGRVNQKQNQATDRCYAVNITGQQGNVGGVVLAPTLGTCSSSEHLAGKELQGSPEPAAEVRAPPVRRRSQDKA